MASLDAKKLALFCHKASARSKRRSKESVPRQKDLIGFVPSKQSKVAAYLRYKDRIVDNERFPLEIWLDAYLRDKNILKYNAKEKWNEMVWIDDLEIDDGQIVRIYWHKKVVIDFLNNDRPNQSIWCRR